MSLRVSLRSGGRVASRPLIRSSDGKRWKVDREDVIEGEERGRRQQENREGNTGT